MAQFDRLQQVIPIIENQLHPHVSKIDLEGMYPEHFIRLLGQKGHYVYDYPYNIRLIEEVAKVCGSTAFLVWCQAMVIDFLRKGNSHLLRKELLPQLEKGEVLGGTGLSNPMKFYAGMEPIRLKATKTSEGYKISGVLPFVSNLGESHWMAVIFQTEDERRVMAFLPCNSKGLKITELTSFMGMNGTATYSCDFHDVLLPGEYVLSEEADEMVKTVRPGLVISQTGISLGVVHAAIEGMKRLQEKQGGVNQFLQVQPQDLEPRLIALKERVYQVAERGADLVPFMKEIFRLRLETAYLTIDAANAGILYTGGAGYVASHPASRRLREAYFYALITPSVKQLEKVIQTS